MVIAVKCFYGHHSFLTAGSGAALSKPSKLTTLPNSSSDWLSVSTWESRQGLIFSLIPFFIHTATSLTFHENSCGQWMSSRETVWKFPVFHICRVHGIGTVNTETKETVGSSQETCFHIRYKKLNWRKVQCRIKLNLIFSVIFCSTWDFFVTFWHFCL